MRVRDSSYALLSTSYESTMSFYLGGGGGGRCPWTALSGLTLEHHRLYCEGRYFLVVCQQQRSSHSYQHSLGQLLSL